MDFITDLPECSSSRYNGIFTVVDRLTKYCRLIPIVLGGERLSAPYVAQLFF